MPLERDHYSSSGEALLVGLSRNGDRHAFAELVRRRQPWIRNLMRRCCRDITLADDLAQQVFLQAWRSIRHLQQPGKFGAWLKRLAINVWLQHQRKNDPLQHADEHEEISSARQDAAGIAMDLDRALASLADTVKLCIILSYHEGMTHREIAEFTGLPPGTVKSHIRRGTERLQQQLSAYKNTPHVEDAI